MKPREPQVSLVCRCGVEFTRPAWRVRQAAKQGATLHCSYDCAHAARRTRTAESKAEYHRLYREKNRESINQKQSAARRGEQREHILARDREIYRRNAEVNRQRAREYAAKHPDAAKARSKAWPAQNPERANFHIVRSNLAQSTGLLPREIPDDLVEAKVEQLKIMRWVRDQTAIATGTQSAETNEDSAQSEGCHSGAESASPDPRRIA